jgi:hypothetical protein
MAKTLTASLVAKTLQQLEAIRHNEGKRPVVTVWTSP